MALIEDRPVIDLGTDWDFAPAPWIKGAACGSHEDPELWHPEHERDLLRLRTAKSICNSCPVQSACLEYAITEQIWHGIWGGLTSRERHSLIRRRRLERTGSRG